MTNNQLRFAQLREDIRHHKQEESVASLSQAETARHNYAYEGIQRSGVQETARHNVQTENINWYTAENTAALQQTQQAVNTANVDVLKAERGRVRAQAAEATARSNLLRQQTATEVAKLDLTQAQAVESSARATQAMRESDLAVAKAEQALANANASLRQASAAQQNADVREKEYRQKWWEIGIGGAAKFFQGAASVLPMLGG